MDISSKGRIKALITKDILDIHNRYCEVKKSIEDNLQDVLDYFYELRAQIPESMSRPFITQTPKVPRNRGIHLIDKIPEDIVVDNAISNSITMHVEVEKQKEEEVKSGRLKREASIKAADTIKKQQLLKLSTKLRRPSNTDEQSVDATKNNHERRGKRKQSMRSSSDEENSSGPMKQSKMDGAIPRITTGKKSMATNMQNHHTTITIDQNISPQGKLNATMTLRCEDQKRSSTQSQNMNSKLGSRIGDMTITGDVEELSMYEDAIEKPSPIMSSTINCNSTIAIQNMVNATVVLDRLSAIKANETITINKESGSSSERSDQKNELKLPRIDSPYTDSSSSSSEYEVPCTPPKTVMKGVNTGSAIVHNIRNKFKPKTLFSPYAKEAVEKRIAAFEEAKMNSPQPTVEADAPTRLTRTKTRAMAAARAETAECVNNGVTVGQKIARKSLAKAKKTSLVKRAKPIDNYKENLIQAAQRIQKQQKTASSQKIKTQLPMSVSRIAHTPVNDQYNSNHNKALSAARTNIITSTDSFVQVSKIASKSNFTQKTEQEKRKVNDDDAKRKREEALRLQIEEKRRNRQEKELKNKIAREAKDKQDVEKRQKVAKEREEKARLAQQMQEKQREELKKKRLVQNQRVNSESNKNQHPTNYVLDSEPDDDESDNESRPKHRIPYWAYPEIRKAHLSIQWYIPQRAVFRFFDTRKCTPDLTQLFQGIDRRKLQRTSSAIWKTPPRYSMMEAE